MARQLKQLGVTRVRPLAGGLHGWRKLGFPLEHTGPAMTPVELKASAS